MARSLDKIKFGLKLRTNSTTGALSLKMGVRKMTLPFEARLIKSDEYVFVHIPPSAEIFKIDGKALRMVTESKEAEEAVVSFRKARKRGKRASAKDVEMPSELETALKKIPDGFKLGYDESGNVRLVKKRTRRKKSK